MCKNENMKQNTCLKLCMLLFSFVSVIFFEIIIRKVNIIRLIKKIILKLKEIKETNLGKYFSLSLFSSFSSISLVLKLFDTEVIERQLVKILYLLHGESKSITMLGMIQ